MERYVVRVWLPDRPGALGQVATRIGACRGDVVGIDILERGGGRAVDELVVDLPAGAPLDDLVRAICSVDDVDVEEVRPLVDAVHDPLLDALETAALLVGATRTDELTESLVWHARRVIGGAWSALVRLSDGDVVASEGPVPSPAWLVAFVEGSRSSARVASGEAGPDDVVWAPLPATDLALVLGRDGTAYRARERHQVAALARIADTRLHEVARLRAMRRHPSLG